MFVSLFFQSSLANPSIHTSHPSTRAKQDFLDMDTNAATSVGSWSMKLLKDLEPLVMNNVQKAYIISLFYEPISHFIYRANYDSAAVSGSISSVPLARISNKAADLIFQGSLG